MAFFGFRANRYVPDFQATLILLLALTGGFGATFLERARLRFRAWRFAFCLLAIVTALGNILLGMQWADHLQNFRPRTYAALARWGEFPAYFLARWGLLDYGPVRFRVAFPPTDALRQWPLLATGTPNSTDVLYAIAHPPGTIEFALSHEGYGSLRSALLPLKPGDHAIEVDMGSLYPPRIDPFFDGWTSGNVEKIKTTARVLFDGQEVIRGRLRSYDSPPSWVEFGRNPAGPAPPFAGKITAIERLPARDPQEFARLAEPGVWRLQLELPARPSADRSPVLGSGVAGHGNLLLLQRLPDRRVVFGVDQWGGGLSVSPPQVIDPARPHLLEIFVGPQVARLPLPAGWKIDPAAIKASATQFRLWLDGSPVWTTTVIVNQDSYDFVSIGTNPQGFSTAPAFFDGAIRSLPYADAEMRAFIVKNLGAPRTP
jgi:hypothetical protein